MNCKTLPKGYRYAGTMDFTRNRKQIVGMLKLALVLTAVTIIVGVLLWLPAPEWPEYLRRWTFWVSIPVFQVAYIPLHELTHGIVMYALSGVRPSFGIKLPYAWCGSTVWFDRKSHILTALAPVVFWGVALTILALTLPKVWFWPLWLAQISNTSGSAGDIYCVYYLARMDGDLLIQDTGTRMRIMRLNEQ